MKFFIIASLLFSKIAFAGFGLYAGIYGGLQRSTDSFLYSKFEPQSEYLKNLKITSDTGKAIGGNIGAELSLVLVSFAIEAFAEKSGGYQTNLFGNETLNIDYESFTQDATFNIAMQYKNPSAIGVLGKIAFNLWLFDLYLGAGFARQSGNMDLNVTNNVTCNPVVYQGQTVNPCLAQSGNFSSNMIVGSVGIQKRLFDFGIYLDLTTYVPTKLSVPDVNSVAIDLLTDAAFQEQLKGLKSARTMLKLGVKYYFF